METLIKVIDGFNANQSTTTAIEVIEEAANILLNGGLVAFPTETVYGIGAYAFDVGAIKKIYETKGRPSDNPLIMHVATPQQLMDVISNEPNQNTPIAEKLMQTFWPGPLTLILPKNKKNPTGSNRRLGYGCGTLAIQQNRPSVSRKNGRNCCA